MYHLFKILRTEMRIFISSYFFLVIIQNEPELLEEYGGNLKLNVSWAKSFLKRIDAKEMLKIEAKKIVKK